MRVPRLRQPGIDARVGVDDLVVAEVEAARDVGERVLVRRNRGLQRADHARRLRIVRERVRRQRLRILRRRRLGRWRRLLAACEYAAARERRRASQRRDALRSCVGTGSPKAPVMSPLLARLPARPRGRSKHGGPVRQFVLVAPAGQRRVMACRAGDPPRCTPQRRRPHNARRGSPVPSSPQTADHSAALTRPLNPRSATISTSRSASST